MELVTWNLNGLEDRHLDARTEAALTEILLGGDMAAVIASGKPPALPDVILLQEVVERTFVAHVVPHLRAAGFALVPAQPPDRSYFEVAAVRSPVKTARWVPFPRTGQRRMLLELELTSGLVISTAHLESLKPSQPLRVEQAAFVLDRMRDRGPAVFAGDTNLRKAEWEGLDATGVLDAFEAMGSPPSERCTWSRARYDRVWMSEGLHVTGFRRIGLDDVPGLGEPPSDHVGLRVSWGMPSDG